MFCSEKCRDETYAKVKNLDSMLTNDLFPMYPERLMRECEEAFGGRQKLSEFLKQNDWKNLNCTIFDFDFSNPDDPEYKANLIKCVLALGTTSSEDGYWEEKGNKIKSFVKAAAGRDALLEQFLMELEMIYTARAYSDTLQFDPYKAVQKTPFLIGVNLLSSNMNNRCKPNAFVLNDEIGGGICITKPIKAGEEIFRNYQ